MDSGKLSLYIHIPFCVRKCLYCDFLSFSADRESRYEQYFTALEEEITEVSPMYRENEVVSIFFGGGTPSLMGEELYEHLMFRLRKLFRISPACEITMECNPGTVTEKKLKAFRKLGINRLSIGLQSASDEELEILGRIHTRGDFEKCYAAAVSAGFSDINVDLMSGIPGQSPEDYRDTLSYVTSLDPAPPHISSYSLMIEEGTPFDRKYGEDGYRKEDLPDEDSTVAMMKLTAAYLTKAGYHRYEISNYARKGYECRHNTVYWKRGAYLGLGLGAASMADNIRWNNTASMGKYLSGNRKKENYQVLTEKEQMEEFMFLGLRMTEGIRVSDFESCFHRPFPKQYWDAVYHYRNLSLVELCEDPEGVAVRLTEDGFLVSNRILSEFLF